MPRLIPTDELDQIENAVRAHSGITSAEIADVLGEQVPRRTLQFRLKRLVDDGRVVREGEGRWTRYSAPGAAPAPAQPEAAADEAAVALTPESQEIRAYLRQPLAARKPVGYNREFLNAYRPGETFYLPEGARARLAEIGARPVRGQEPAGTYARQILNRLLIELVGGDQSRHGQRPRSCAYNSYAQLNHSYAQQSRTYAIIVAPIAIRATP